jgi:plastocyanin
MKKKCRLIIILAIILIFGLLLVVQKFTAIKPFTFFINLFKNDSLDASKEDWTSAEKQLNIFIRDQKFLPNASGIKTDTKVSWFNEDNKIHNVTGDGWSSDDLVSGQSYTRVFDAAGDYKYHCSIHPEMTGEIIVR